MGCLNNPTSRRKPAGQEVIIETSSSQFAKNNHRISIEQRLPSAKAEAECGEQSSNKISHQSGQLKANPAAPQDPLPQSQHLYQPPESPKQRVEASPPVCPLVQEDQQSYQSVKDYFAGLCTQGAMQAQVFQKLGRKRIEIPIT